MQTIPKHLAAAPPFAMRAARYGGAKGSRIGAFVDSQGDVQRVWGDGLKLKNKSFRDFFPGCFMFCPGDGLSVLNSTQLKPSRQEAELARERDRCEKAKKKAHPFAKSGGDSTVC